MRLQVVVVAVTSVAAATGLFVGTASAARHAPRGHLTAAAQPPGYKEVTGTAKTIGAGKAGTVTVTCPTGTVAVGGGESNPSGSTLVTLSSSYPTGQKWTATVGNGTTSKVKAQAVATCMTKPSGSAVVKATVANGSQSQTEEIATCKGSTVAIGGGQKTTSSLQQATNTSESGNGSNWVVYENNRDLSAHNFTVYAICAKQPSGYAIVQSSPITNPGGIQASGGATCPAGVPLSGGVNSVSTDLYADMNQSEPFGGDGWQATMNNVNSTPTSFTVEVICAT